MSYPLHTWSWFPDNQSLLIFLIVAFLAEKHHHTNFNCIWLNPIGLEPTIYHTREKHANRLTPNRLVLTTIVKYISNKNTCFNTFSYFCWNALLVPLWSKSWHKHATINARHSLSDRFDLTSVFWKIHKNTSPILLSYT